MKGRLAKSVVILREHSPCLNQAERWEAQGSFVNVTRMVAQCNLGGEGVLEHDPWKTMEQLNFAHCVRDGVMGGGIHSVPGIQSREEAARVHRGQPPHSVMEGRRFVNYTLATCPP